jgi:alpha-beta hydrolase superfamily lysophospholipase
MSTIREAQFYPFYSRFINFGVSYGDLERLSSASKDWNSFSRGLADLGERWEDSAETLHKKGWVTTPREHWQHAADYFHHAQIKVSRSLLKESLRRASRRSYQRLAPRLDPPAVRCTIPYQPAALTGYLRIHHPGAPCVILIGGLESAKEVELHYFAEGFLKRGCSVFYFDGPGQGELDGRTQIERGFEKVIGSVIAFLSENPLIGSAGIGCFGIALGGYLACGAAAANPRIGACISLGGFFDARVLKRLPGLARMVLQEAYGLSGDDAQDLVPLISLASSHRQMKAPLLLVHGASDHPVDIDQVKAMQNWAGGHVDTITFDGADHICTDRFSECISRMCDWMTNWLIHKDSSLVAVV